MRGAHQTLGFPSLGHWAEDGSPLFAKCRGCGRQVCLTPAPYVARFGRHMGFWRTMRRLSCTVCRSKADIRRVPDGQVTHNLMEIFRPAFDEDHTKVFDAMLSRADESKHGEAKPWQETRLRRLQNGQV